MDNIARTNLESYVQIKHYSINGNPFRFFLRNSWGMCELYIVTYTFVPPIYHPSTRTFTDSQMNKSKQLCSQILADIIDKPQEWRPIIARLLLQFRRAMHDKNRREGND